MTRGNQLGAHSGKTPRLSLLGTAGPCVGNSATQLPEWGVGRNAPGFSHGDVEPHQGEALRPALKRCADWPRTA